MSIKRLFKKARKHKWTWRELLWVIQGVMAVVFGVKMIMAMIFMLSCDGIVVWQCIGLALGGVLFVFAGLGMVYVLIRSF